MNVDTSALKNQSTVAENQAAPKQTGFRKWTPLVVLSLALAIIVLDTTILNVSLRTIINDLHTNIQAIQWVITAYSLMLAAFTITGGRLGDLFGRKKMFVLGAVIFAVGSFMTSISKNVGFMIAGEAIVEGIGAAMMMPATASLLVSNYKGRDRQLAFGVWGGIAAASAAFGPVFGGWLTTTYSWRWAFRINVVVALILVAGSFLIKEFRDREEKSSIDYVGVILSALGMLSMVFGFIKASDYGWWKVIEPFTLLGHTLNLGGLSATPYFVLLGLVILGLFGLWEYRMQKRDQTPLVSLDLFKNSQFTVGATIIAIISLGLAGISFTIPVFFQAVKNLDAVHTGIAMLPMSLSLLVSAPLSAYISKFISPKFLIQSGLVITGAGFYVLGRLFSTGGSQWHIAPGLILFGVGMGFIMSQANNVTLSAVSVQESGEASGVNSTLRQLGATLGSAVLGAILISTLGTNVLNGINNSQIIPVNAKAAISNELKQQSSNIEFGSGPVLLGNVPAAVTNEIVSVTRQATVDGNRTTADYAIIFIVLAFLISFKLPGGLDVEMEKSVGAHHDSVLPEGAVQGSGAMALSSIDPGPSTPTGAGRSSSPDSDKNMSEKKSSAGVPGGPGGMPPRRKLGGANPAANFAGTLILSLALAGAGGVIGYMMAKNKQNNTAPQNTQDQTPTAFSPTPQGGRDSNSSTPAGGQTSGSAPASGGQANAGSPPASKPAKKPAAKTPTVLGSNTAPRDGAVGSHVYTNSALRFSVRIPDNWKVTASSNEVLFTGPNHAAYSIQLYGVTNNTDLGFIATKLAQQPNIHNVTPTTFAGAPAMAFSVDGVFQQGYALVNSGRLYYVLGPNAGTQLSTFSIN